MVKEGHKPELIIIAGPNGSGKTSVTKRFLHHEWAEGTTYINPDEVANDMFGDWNSRDAVLSAAKYCAEWREKCLIERKSFVFETVMSAIDKVDFIAKAKKYGFFIRVFFISTESPKINAPFLFASSIILSVSAKLSGISTRTSIPRWSIRTGRRARCLSIPNRRQNRRGSLPEGR